MSKYEDDFRKALEEKEYKKYPAGRTDPESVIALFQKRFDDDQGIKYFVDIHEYSFENFPEVPPQVQDNYRFEGELSFTLKSNGKPVDIKCFIGWTLDEIEQYAEDLWKSGMYEFYEEW